MSGLKLFLPEKAPSHRQEKVAETIRHVLSSICMQGDYPPICEEDGSYTPFKGSVIITKVTISADLKHATAYFMTQLGKELESTKKYLNLVKSHFRYVLGKNITIKYVPTVQFDIDRSFEAMDKIDTLLKGVVSQK
ncbi:MAG: ribosome-binding factor A [Proteobacteria bacterium]|nr:ribosome-binding factor A [Pseudomonadota bacterium]